MLANYLCFIHSVHSDTLDITNQQSTAYTKLLDIIMVARHSDRAHTV